MQQRWAASAPGSCVPGGCVPTVQPPELHFRHVLGGSLGWPNSSGQYLDSLCR
jgi:hypothetical protein